MLNLHSPFASKKKALPSRLTEKQLVKRLELPEGSEVTQLENAFYDSTHDIYIIRDVDASSPSCVVKVLRPTALKESRFWELMHDCFNAGLIAQTACFYATYPLIKEISPLTIPTLKQQIIEPDLPESPKNSGLYLTQAYFLEGSAITNVTPEMVQDLAKHMACLHLSESDHFGTIDEPIAPCLHDWPSHLKRVMGKHMENSPEIPQYTRQRILAQIESQFQTNEFCLIMPDLRWDQFLEKDNKLFALTDLDAIVYGPKELDWVLLEYLLSPTQAEMFLQEYTQFLAVPDLTEVRDVYRVLLYMMNVLGETDFEAWMKQPKLFNALSY
ncbi:aminoglycoside phosphotransferase/kinase family protein [Hydrogenovibrio kuenenii]|uniref:hypothetical protein n=1 Tax=Hydrogenovibrio kuenenii TaxID=63658 RepID=UPI000467EA90|nr:hypothetical protein [Hydrogenovibrio kuenenii]